MIIISVILSQSEQTSQEDCPRVHQGAETGPQEQVWTRLWEACWSGFLASP